MNRSCRIVALVCSCFLALFPASALGDHAGVTGTLVETHGHRPDGTEVGKSFAIRSGGGVRPLADSQPQSLIGQRVHTDDDDAAPGLQGTVRAEGEQRLAAAVPPGPRSLLVILVTTPDAPVASATSDAARTAVFTGAASTNALYQQQSGGATRFIGLTRDDGDIAGPLAIGVATTGCNTKVLADAADAAARAAGWAVDAYDHVLYALPKTVACAWAGLGRTPGRQTWSNGDLSTRVVAHELGHNLGAAHANSYRCTDAGGAPVALSTTCETTEYGDPFDVMGLPARLMSSWHRAQLGQLPAGQELTARASQTVTLASSDNFATAGSRLLLVPRKEPRTAVSSWFAVELRSVLGPFDLWATADPVTTGLSVRIVPNLTLSKQSQLLDARPGTSSFADAPLQVGETIRDEAHGIAISLNSITGTAANVTVTMPQLVDDVPPSAPGDVSLSGDTNAVALGWPPADDDEAVSQYEVKRDGVLIGTTPGLRFDDARTAELTSTTYEVTAVDTSGNRGAPAVVTATLADATAPSAVPGLALSARGADVTVSWAPAQDNRAIRSYRVLRDGVFWADVTGFSSTDRPPAGQHRYAVSAVDTAGNIGPPTEMLLTTRPSVTPTRIVLLRRKRKGRVVTLRFAANGATSLAAYRTGRRVAQTSGTHLTLRLRVPRQARRPTVRIIASSPAGHISERFALR